MLTVIQRHIPLATRDPTDPILDLIGAFWMCHMNRTSREVGACHIMDAKIMKHHVLPRELASFGGRFLLLTELLNRHCRTSSTENSSNSQFVVTNLHLFYLTWLIFCSSVCHQSWKTEKISLHDLHMIQLLDYPGSEPSDLWEQEEGKRRSSPGI